MTAGAERLFSRERDATPAGMAAETMANNGIRTRDNVHRRQASGLVLGC